MGHARHNLHTAKHDPRIEHASLKTSAAFLNGRGGTLILGVGDDGSALGLAPDGFATEDRALLHLGNLVRQQLGAPSATYVDPRFEDYDGQRVLAVRCRPSSAPVYVDTGPTEHFYVRTLASTSELKPSEIQDYIRQRFN